MDLVADSVIFLFILALWMLLGTDGVSGLHCNATFYLDKMTRVCLPCRQICVPDHGSDCANNCPDYFKITQTGVNQTGNTLYVHVAIAVALGILAFFLLIVVFVLVYKSRSSKRRGHRGKTMAQVNDNDANYKMIPSNASAQPTGDI